jgi:hypothetical protein
VRNSTSRSSRIVHSGLDVKSWLTSPPSVDAARPGACPGCHRASRPPGRALGLHGHGLRDRQLRGPPDAEAAATTQILVCRRYRCTACGAVIIVVPRGVAPRRHYGHAAIAFALALWALAGTPAAGVRRRVCAWAVTGAAGTRWRALRRWADAAGQTLGISGDRRAAAARAAQMAAGRAPPTVTGPVWILAYAGGAAMP